MSFLRLFPNREYKQIKELQQNERLSYLLTINRRTIIEYINKGEKNTTNNAPSMIRTLVNVDDAVAEEYSQAIRKFFYLAWFSSFIPGQDAYKKRKALSDELEKIKKDFKEKLNDDKKLGSNDKKYNFLQKLAIRTMALPSWQKVLAVSLLTLTLAAITLTGIGALAGLGVFGAAAAGYAVSQLAVTGFATIAANLGINVLTLAAITTAISGFLAVMGLRELLYPGDSFRFLGINKDLRNNNKDLRNNEASWGIMDMNTTQFPPVSYKDVLHVIPFYSYSSNFVKAAFSENKDGVIEIGIDLVRYLFNPFRWVHHSLCALAILGLILIDNTPLAPAIRHGIKGILNFIFAVPLSITGLLDKAIDAPIEIVIFGIKEMVEYLVEFSKKTSYKKSIDVEKKGSVPLTPPPSTRSSYEQMQPSLGVPSNGSSSCQQQYQGNFNKHGDTLSGAQAQAYSTKPMPVPESKENDNSEEDYQQYSYQ